tara:strand:+ start:315 stop:683 length:369 start_codon:yes stop_codon:yes gene_type:complete
MYIRYINTKINDNLFDTRIDLSKLQYYIDKHDLKYIDRYKRYCIENIEIVSNGKTMDYKKTEYEMIGDIIKKTECNYFKFSFYKVDYSETYDLYERDNIKLKKYDKYLTIEQHFNDIEKIKI